MTEQKKGMYKYFVDLGDRMEVATVRTRYIDEVWIKWPSDNQLDSHFI